jgi:HPt (histidine-containing phosphotransfer) domain-containing protein
MADTPVLDLSEALKRAMGDAPFLKMMLEEFRALIPDFITRLENAWLERDLAAIGKDAHQLKGAAANLSAKTVAAAALKLEQIGKSGNPDGCEQALEELKQAVEILDRQVTRIDWAGVASKSPAQG